MSRDKFIIYSITYYI